MRSSSCLFASAALLALGLAAAPAHAAFSFPPAGSHSFIALYEIDSGLHSCPTSECAFASSATTSVSLGPVSFHGSNPIDYIDANARIDGSGMHGFVDGRDAAQLVLAFDDTYTVHGATGPITITARLDGHGSAVSVPFGANNFVLVGNMFGRIGTFDIDPADGLPTVSAFDTVTAEAHSQNVTQLSATPFSVPISFAASHAMTVNPGQVFDLAYELSEAFSVGGVDASNTAVVSFDLPEGVFLTSASGATFGAAPTDGGVPEPAGWALMIGGFALAGARLRRRAPSSI